MVVKCHKMLPLTDTADNVDPANADLANPNVLLCLTDNLALLPFAATFVLGTGNNPMVKHGLVEPAVEVSVGFKLKDLTNALAG